MLHPLTKGTDRQVLVTVMDGSQPPGVVRDLSDVTAVTAYLKKGPTVVLTKTGAGHAEVTSAPLGQITVTLAPADSTGLTAGTFGLEVWVTTSGLKTYRVFRDDWQVVD